MGSPDDEPGREPQERLHRVKLTRGFSIARYETTHAQWSRVMGTNPSHFRDCGTACPVERVNLHDVERFIDSLNARAVNPGFRLPTEAEWAVRAAPVAVPRSATGRPSAAKTPTTTANSRWPGTPKAPARGRPMPVGSFLRTHGDCSTCTATSGSGRPTGIAHIRTDPCLIHRAPATANAALYEAAAFTSTRRAPAAASAIRIAHRIRASASASASPTRVRRNDYP